MSNVSNRRRDSARSRVKSVGDHKEFLKRISKSLYYGKLPHLPCLSLPVTEISAAMYSEAHRGRSLKRLHVDEAAEVARAACVSPASLVIAILYLERLKTSNPDYLARVAPAELFLVSLMVSNKFLQDDGEEDEVFCDEWAASGGTDISTLKNLEKNFLNAIDWRLYVSEQAFESGLSWLEHQVALKQAQLRGFFTYSDLLASSSDLGVGELLKSFSSVCLAMTISYITSLLAVVTSTLLISNGLLTSLHKLADDCSPTTIDSNNSLITPIRSTSSVTVSGNYAIDETEIDLALQELTPTHADSLSSETFEKLTALQSEIVKTNYCYRWCVQAKNIYLNEGKWLKNYPLNEQSDPEPTWWWRTPSFNWLYQLSIISPLQKWFEKLDQWSSLLTGNILNYTEDSSYADSCRSRAFQNDALYKNYAKCTNIWRNLGKIDSFMLAVSDRQSFIYNSPPVRKDFIHIFEQKM